MLTLNYVNKFVGRCIIKPRAFLGNLLQLQYLLYTRRFTRAVHVNIIALMHYVVNTGTYFITLHLHWFSQGQKYWDY